MTERDSVRLWVRDLELYRDSGHWISELRDAGHLRDLVAHLHADEQLAAMVAVRLWMLDHGRATTILHDDAVEAIAAFQGTMVLLKLWALGLMIKLDGRALFDPEGSWARVAK